MSSHVEVLCKNCQLCRSLNSATKNPMKFFSRYFSSRPFYGPKITGFATTTRKECLKSRYGHSRTISFGAFYRQNAVNIDGITSANEEEMGGSLDMRLLSLLRDNPPGAPNRFQLTFVYFTGLKGVIRYFAEMLFCWYHKEYIQRKPKFVHIAVGDHLLIRSLLVNHQGVIPCRHIHWRVLMHDFS